MLQVNLGNRYGEGGAEPKVSEEDDLYLVLEGRQQTHVVTLKHTGDWTWLAPIPGENGFVFACVCVCVGGGGEEGLVERGVCLCIHVCESTSGCF